MKEITQEYIDEKCGKYIAEYMSDKDIIKLVNNINKEDNDLLPVILYIVTINDITEIFNSFSEDLKKENFNSISELIKNKDLIEKLTKIIDFNSPSIAERIDDNGKSSDVPKPKRTKQVSTRKR